MRLATVKEAIEDVEAGKFVIVVDDEDRENEGDLVIAAQHATPDAINFMAQHARGLICTPLAGEILDRLEVPMMVPSSRNGAGFGTNFTVSVEARHGVSTGISAFDRAHTIKVLADPKSKPCDIVMPGHVFPLRAKAGGVLERRGQTEASIDLARLAGLTPAAVVCEVMSQNGEMARLPELLQFGEKHGIKTISVEALAQYRLARHACRLRADSERGSVTRGASTVFPTQYGEFDVVAYRDLDHNEEHLLMRMGAAANGTPLTRLHSACLAGDVMGSYRCDCGEQLQLSLKRIADEGGGILVYLRQEGRGIGLANKIRAYELQDNGMDTVDANLHLGFAADGRSYDVAAAILLDQGIDCIRLMTNNARKVEALEKHGVRVAERIAHEIEPNAHNRRYLETKAAKLGHVLKKVGKKA